MDPLVQTLSQFITPITEFYFTWFGECYRCWSWHRPRNLPVSTHSTSSRYVRCTTKHVSLIEVQLLNETRRCGVPIARLRGVMSSGRRDRDIILGQVSYLPFLVVVELIIS